MSESMNVNTADGQFRAYVARPKAKVAPVVVVLQEIFGINADMRDTCDDLANQGYIAVCPDLFWRMEPGVDMSDQTEAEWKKGFALYTAFDLDTGVLDVAKTIEAGRSMSGASGKVGLMGYCLGGLMTFLSTARTDVDAAAAYYPGGTEKHLEEADAIASPMLMHLAEEDEYISKDAQRDIRGALANRSTVEIFTYPGCNHAFARHRGIHFDAAAAALANKRTSEFLQKHLQLAHEQA
jgi:carboxymethylenebutenolidase